uniref:Uncharacterized protein n=1 Tax=Oryza glumipatula TaxID=40148 RepID=A0A0D9Y940_9ORYZ
MTQQGMLFWDPSKTEAYEVHSAGSSRTPPSEWPDLWLSEEGNERRGGVHAAAPDATQVTTTSARARAPSRLPRADFSWCGDGGKRWGSDGDDMGL